MLTNWYGGEENNMLKGIDSLQFNNYSTYNRINSPVNNADVKNLNEEAEQVSKQEYMRDVDRGFNPNDSTSY